MSLIQKAPTLSKHQPAFSSRVSLKPTVLRFPATAVRADNKENSRVIREYREEDGQLIVPGEQTNITPGQDGQPLYADQVAGPGPVQKQGNLSKEMKARLRAEYTGWGGAENKVVAPTRFVVAAASTLERPPADPAAQPSTSAPAAAAAAAAAAAKGSSKWTIDENEVLHSTWEHRLWTYGCMALLGGTFAEALMQAQVSGDWASVGLSFLTAYLLADLGTGIYHHSVDNYGGPDTPVFGKQIAAFQGHHQRPWTITQREFANNLHQVFKPATPFAAAFFFAAAYLPASWNAFVSSFIFLVCMSQQFHAWSHTKKSQLPAVVVALQDAGILVSRKMHGAHHRAPFEGNYCIVSGLWNGPLDGSGFFRAWEKFIFDRTGVEPRCWHEPEYEWKEAEVD